MNGKFDVVIVGAGPSGAICGAALAARGARVLVVEKDKFPRYKTCAGGITLKTKNAVPFDISSVISRRIRRVEFSYKLRDCFIRETAEPFMFTVRRPEFDALLMHRAVASGAQFTDRLRFVDLKFRSDDIEVITDSGTFRTRILVGADGANSRVVKKLRLTQCRRYSLGLELEIKENRDDEETIHLDYGTLPSGYAWIFPKQGESAVGVGGPVASAKLLRPYLTDFLQYKNFAGPGPVRYRGHLLPLRYGTEPLHTHRALIVGDAAGLIDHLTGEGIYSAVRSGQIAAEVISDYLNGKTASLENYTSRIQDELMKDIRASARALRVFDSLTPLFHSGMKHSRGAWDQLVRLMKGDKSFHETITHPVWVRFLFRATTRFLDWKNGRQQ